MTWRPKLASREPGLSLQCLRSPARSMSAAVAARGPRARWYPNALAAHDKAFWDYESLQVTWGEQDDYEVVRKVGRGKVRAKGPAGAAGGGARLRPRAPACLPRPRGAH